MRILVLRGLLALVATVVLVTEADAQKTKAPVAKPDSRSELDTSFSSRHALAREFWRKFGFEDGAKHELEKITLKFESPEAKEAAQHQTMALLHGYLIEELPVAIDIFMDTLATPMAQVFTASELQEMLSWSKTKEPTGPLRVKMDQVIKPMLESTFSSDFGHRVGKRMLDNAIDRLPEPDRSQVKAFFDNHVKQNYGM